MAPVFSSRPVRRVRAAVVAAAVGLAVSAFPATADPAPTVFIDSTYDVEVTEGVVYGEAVNARGETEVLAMDIYRPIDNGADTARPSVIAAHGGSFKNGDRTSGATVQLARDLAERGFVTASISYRLRPSGTPGSKPNHEIIVDQVATDDNGEIRDARHDMAAAVRYFRFHAADLGIDPDMISVSGNSAGAVAALFTHHNAHDPGTTNDLDVSSETAAAVAFAGAVDPRHPDIGDGPVLLFHGTNDTTVPYALGVDSCVATMAKTNVCEMVHYAGAGHEIAGVREPAKTADFLCRHVVLTCGQSGIVAPIEVK